MSDQTTDVSPSDSRGLFLPGVDWAGLGADELTDREVDSLHSFTGEGLLARDPDKYHAVVRGLFAEGLGVRVLARLLHVSPQTIHAIEQREISLHPELISELGRQANKSLAIALKRGADAASRAFLADDLSPVEIAKSLSILSSISRHEFEKKPAESRESVETDDYMDVVSSDGFGGGINSEDGIAGEIGGGSADSVGCGDGSSAGHSVRQSGGDNDLRGCDTIVDNLVDNRTGSDGERQGEGGMDGERKAP